MGNGLEYKTVLVLPPGKSWHASLCAFKLCGFERVYLACTEDKTAESGSKGEAGFRGDLTEPRDTDLPLSVRMETLGNLCCDMMQYNVSCARIEKKPP
jgi:hypothetical protein